MLRSKVQDEIEMSRRTVRIFPDERKDQSKPVFPAQRVDRIGLSRFDGRNFDKMNAWTGDRCHRNRFILDPDSNTLLGWNKFFFFMCLLALFVDPFFYYVPLVKLLADYNSSCVHYDRNISITMTVLRSIVDVFYILNILMKFRTAYPAPNSSVLGKGELVTDPAKIRKRYMKSELFVDLVTAFPLPQVVLWSIVPAIQSSDLNVKNTTLGLVIASQYILRMYLIIPLRRKIIKAAGVVTKTAWGGAAYNLVLYMLASHITGAIYYLLTIERQITCWDQQCLSESNATNCDLNYINCHRTGSDRYRTWANSTSIFAKCNASNGNIAFNFGIFSYTLSIGAVSTSFHEKYFYNLWWGLEQLSSSGNPLTTSTFITENIFAICIGAVSLILFAHLIGDMQTFLQSMSKRLEEWRLRQRDIEEWMRHHHLPPHLQNRVRRFLQVKWLAKRGVDEDTILQCLPSEIRRDVQRHLCLDLVRRVPFFSEMDDQLLDAICERLPSFLCPEDTFIAREGDPVNEMFFIIRGKLESFTTDGGRTNFFNSIMLQPGDFCGEELVTWALDPGLSMPTSTRTVRSLTEVEAFALRAEDLIFVAKQFKRMHSKKLQHTLKFYSHAWRLWAASFIQAAWRRYQKRKMAEALRMMESRFWSFEELQSAHKLHGGASSSSAMANAAAISLHKLASASRRYMSDDTALPRFQKPDEPDFSADHLD